MLSVCVQIQILSVCSVGSNSFASPWTVACQAFLFMGFSRQVYWGVLPFSPAGDLPDSGIKTASPVSPALAGGFFTTEPPGNLRTEILSFLRKKKTQISDEASSEVKAASPSRKNMKQSSADPLAP